MVPVPSLAQIMEAQLSSSDQSYSEDTPTPPSSRSDSLQLSDENYSIMETLSSDYESSSPETPREDDPPANKTTDPKRKTKAKAGQSARCVNITVGPGAAVTSSQLHRRPVSSNTLGLAHAPISRLASYSATASATLSPDPMLQPTLLFDEFNLGSDDDVFDPFASSFMPPSSPHTGFFLPPVGPPMFIDPHAAMPHATSFTIDPALVAGAPTTRYLCSTMVAPPLGPPVFTSSLNPNAMHATPIAPLLADSIRAPPQRVIGKKLPPPPVDESNTTPMHVFAYGPSTEPSKWGDFVKVTEAPDTPRQRRPNPRPSPGSFAFVVFTQDDAEMLTAGVAPSGGRGRGRAQSVDEDEFAVQTPSKSKLRKVSSRNLAAKAKAPSTPTKNKAPTRVASKSRLTGTPAKARAAKSEPV